MKTALIIIGVLVGLWLLLGLLIFASSKPLPGRKTTVRRCPVCGGLGIAPDYEGNPSGEPCTQCEGSGTLPETP